MTAAADGALERTGEGDPLLSSVRQMRIELLRSMAAVRTALAAAAPEPADAWVAGVDFALLELREDVREHITVTEGPGGLHPDILASAPRLATAVHRLGREHELITTELSALLTQTATLDAAEHVDAIRTRATDLLALIARHQQRGADLIYEAYESDIGGET